MGSRDSCGIPYPAKAAGFREGWDGAFPDGPEARTLSSQCQVGGKDEIQSLVREPDPTSRN